MMETDAEEQRQKRSCQGKSCLDVCSNSAKQKPKIALWLWVEKCEAHFVCIDRYSSLIHRHHGLARPVHLKVAWA